ncbi:DUF882 domain-containing protein [Mesorhizobium sp.]|uniref:DUF882 domain-containing protein n=1 Tax=Mesorhizobium sp. TaxID=1871066 RepID=UPI000FE3285B|nr:DUF882 domain-containing protein [Mesorhizobium sp.]RWN55471.1 MAG: DUF882 domain-containing protein [Mesorhizobium sp.]RWN77380.1 MAG: DUF882 domain-containing protein [Mesorhizobium sp.]RWN80083.1 MAG: DUF882 domain-containing protein [Mesorhizobium sp.]RWN87282.1 MAG: DUF882 domain-containing protein [Mesorhizobium sp.]RWO15116.1 MAG: DUF882 domain-containing protein [Mesorhizobium sp.]
MSAWPRWLAAVILAFGFLTAAATGASAQTRSLKLYNLHTKEKAEIVFKRGGRYDQAGLKKINVILRDWRRNEPTKMDPRLLDLVWEAYRQSGARDYIQVVCGYRSSSTNSMLRSRSRGVAKKSQHTLGKAMDFYIPGVPLKKLRDIGLRMQGGGVGYYPRSGSPFVHMDVGNVRHWPGISRQELARVFPNGKTLHVPSDGKPLPGYSQALASYKARKGAGAPAIEMASAGGGAKRSGGLLATFFGGGEDEADDSADVVAAPTPKSTNVKPASVKLANAKPAPAARNSKLPGIAIVSPEDAKRAEIPQIADAPAPEPEEDTPETIIAALPARSVPLPDFAPRPKADVAQPPENVPFGVADATATTEQAVTTAQAPANAPFGMAEPSVVADAEQVAANNIPLPSWRPNHSLPADLAAADLAPQDKAVLLALADTAGHGKTATDVFSVLPSARPDLAQPEMAQPDQVQSAAVQSDAVKAVLERVSATDEYQVASLSQPSAVLGELAKGNAASPRDAVFARPAGSDPAAAIGTGVKTTRKAARATARDLKPGPKSVVVAAEPTAARWALNSGENVATVSSATTAQRYAYNIVHTPPTEVYTVGFQADDQLADANRFTGNAVKFLSVARFRTE